MPTQRIEAQLAERLKWEAVWNDSGVPMRLSGQPERLYIFRTSEVLAYCSHGLGLCESYEINGSSLGVNLAAESLAESGRTDDYSAIRKFVRKNLRQELPESVGMAGSWDLRQPHGLAGIMLWTASIRVGTASEIIRSYRDSRPLELASLHAWISERFRGFKSVSIACFKGSDPFVHVFGERTVNSVSVLIGFNRESEEWFEAGMLEQQDDPALLDKERGQILALKCDEVRFVGARHY